MSPNTVLIVGGGVRPPEPIANEIITPGHLLETLSTGRVGLHASAGGPAIPMFALEQDYVGDTISDTYASGDRVHALIAEKGARIYAWLQSGQNVAQGAKLISNGNGNLKAWASGPAQNPGSIVGIAAEAVNASSATSRITVEVI